MLYEISLLSKVLFIRKHTFIQCASIFSTSLHDEHMLFIQKKKSAFIYKFIKELAKVCGGPNYIMPLVGTPGDLRYRHADPIK